MNTSAATQSLMQRWKTWTSAIIGTATIIYALWVWADDRWVNHGEINMATLVRVSELKPLRENVETLTKLMLEDRIVSLDNRIQLLEAYTELSDDQRRTLNELRFERAKFQRRLEKLERDAPVR